ncbi:MAG: hypothetical protein JXA22_04580 [Candidatus Thermoplasmatota archaeon]|nr:hypothetical protein [Candidatus Thermoplasmatota archaeon]
MKDRACTYLLLLCLIFTSMHALLLEGKAEMNIDEDAITRSPDDLPYLNERIYNENDLVYRATAADLMANNPGPEMATCSKNGNVVVTYGSRLSWTSTLVHTSVFSGGAGEKAQVFSLDSGDVLPEDEGDELIAVDERYAVNLIAYDEGSGKWSSTILWKDTDWLYEVDIGELVGGTEQVEMVVVGEQKRATMLSRSGASWVSTTIATDIDIFEACWIADIYTDRPGNEVVLGGGRGILFISYFDGNIWNQEEIMDVGGQVTDVTVVDLDPTIPGDEIYASTINGDVLEVYLKDGNWSKTIVHAEGKLIYGMETGYLGDGNALSIASYDNRVGLIWYSDGFRFREIYREEYIIMGTAIFDIDPAYEGNEVLSLSYLGRVTMIFQEDAGAELILPFEETSLSVGEKIRVPFIVEKRGGYEGSVELSLFEISENINASIPATTVGSGTISYLEIEARSPTDQPLEVRIYANTSMSSSIRSLMINIEGESKVFQTVDHRIDAMINADSQVDLPIEIYSDNEQPFVLGLSKIMIPRGLDIENLDGILTVSSGINMVSGILSAERWISVRVYMFFIILDGGNGTYRAVAIEASVQDWREPTFKLQLETSRISIPEGGNATVRLYVIAENGFQGNVTISTYPDVPGISIVLSKNVIQPTGSVDIFIEVVLGVGDDLLQMKGTSGVIMVETYLTVSVLPPAAVLDIDLDPNGYGYVDTEDSKVSSEFWVVLTPVNGEFDGLVLRVDGLPQNFSISITPSTIQKLFFPLNISIRIEGPRREAPSSLILNISGPDEGPWEAEVQFWIKENGEDDGVSGILLIIVIVLCIMIVIAVAVGIFFKNHVARGLKHGETHHDPDEMERPHRRPAAPERFHGSRGGNDRIHH